MSESIWFAETCGLVSQDEDVPRALLLTKDKRIPLMWKVLNNRFNNIHFGVHRDAQGFQHVMLEVPEGTKIIVYGVGSHEPTPYSGQEVYLLGPDPLPTHSSATGSTKFDALSQYFESVLDGTAVLKGPSDDQRKPRAEDDGRPHFVNDQEQAIFDEHFGEWREMREKLKAQASTADATASPSQSSPSSPSETVPESTTATLSPDTVVAEETPSPEPIIIAETEAAPVISETETETKEEGFVLPTATTASSEPEHTSAEEQAATVQTNATPEPVPTEPSVTETLSETASETSIVVPSETIAEEDCVDEGEEPDQEGLPSESPLQTQNEAPRPTDEL